MHEPERQREHAEEEREDDVEDAQLEVDAPLRRRPRERLEARDERLGRPRRRLHGTMLVRALARQARRHNECLWIRGSSRLSCAVVEKKSFSQAAERLGVTQPAVSLQIQALEKRLGVQLVDRSGRRVEPTEAGQRLYRNAQRVLAAEEQLYDELAEGERITGRLELGASTGPGGSVVPVILGELARTQPRAERRADRRRHASHRRARRRPRARARHRRLRAAPPLRRVRAALPRPGRARVSAGSSASRERRSRSTTCAARA